MGSETQAGHDIQLVSELELTLEEYLVDHGAIDAQGRSVLEAKPLLMGEFEVFRNTAPSVTDAARILVDWQAAAGAFVFDGWLLWRGAPPNWSCKPGPP